MRDRSRQKHFALWAQSKIDPEWQKKELDARAWRINRHQNGKFYVEGDDWTNGRNIRRYLHRVIMNAPPGVEVDHINGDTLDNRRCNLRFATSTQQKCNQRPRGGTSKYKGVGWHKRDRKWRAQITYHGKQISLGYFDGELGAAFAYDVAARILFGEFARLNFQEAD